MSYAVSETETYSVADIEVVMRRVTADLIMIADSTGAITQQTARNWGNDIEVLAKEGYLKSVDLTLLSAGVEMRATRYEVNTNSGQLTASRPGGVLWPRVSVPHLRIVIQYTSSYTEAARAKVKSKLKIGWVTSYDDTSHSSLSQNGGRDYASNSYGLQRKDFTQ